MAVGMCRVRRQNAINGRGGRAEPKDRVALLCLVVYSIAIHARPPVLSIKASAMVRAWAVSSMVSSLHDRRVENKFHAARSISQSDCSVLYQGDTCMEIGLSRRVPISPLSKSTCCRGPSGRPRAFRVPAPTHLTRNRATRACTQFKPV